MGVNEGFAIAARAQLANISAFSDTMTNINTAIDVANTALQSLSTITGQVQSARPPAAQDINSTGQTIAQGNAAAELSSMLGILNTQAGDRYHVLRQRHQHAVGRIRPTTSSTAPAPRPD